MGRVRAERMVAISVILSRDTYLALKRDADEQRVVVAELVQSIIDAHFGRAKDKIDQEQTLALLMEALSQKDAIAEAIQKAVTAYIDSRLPVTSS